MLLGFDKDCTESVDCFGWSEHCTRLFFFNCIKLLEDELLTKMKYKVRKWKVGDQCELIDCLMGLTSRILY